MKISTLLSLLFVGLIACYTPFQSYQYGAAGLKSVPQPPPHKNEVKIFFQGEPTLDTSTYLKVSVIEIKAPGQTSYNKLVEMMQAKAQQEGIDAVILLDKDVYSVTTGSRYGTSSRRYVSTSVYETLSGLGIRYRNHFEYIRNYPKKINIQQVSAENGILAKPLKVWVDFDRKATKIEAAQKIDENLYSDFVQPYTVFELIDAKKGWGFPADYGGAADPRYLTQKVYPANSATILKKYTYSYYGGSISQIVLKKYQQKLEKASLIYNSQKQIQEIFIRKSKNYQLREIFTYDAEGRIVSTDIYSIKNDKSELFLKVNYEFYTPADLGL